jgi:putative ABC transport system ATP-binding protein
VDVLRVEDLTKVFGEGHRRVTAVEAASFTLAPGELMGLLGPSGSGKTTLLLSLSLVLEPTSGLIVFGNRELYRDGWAAGLDTRLFRRESIGFVFQGHNLIPFLTARDNVALVMRLDGASGRAARGRADELLDYLEVGHRAGAMPDELSGGEQQRVAIARALANEPKLILADEPTASLDTERGLKVIELLKRAARQYDAAVITVTHDERMIAGFDTVWRMKDGRLSVDRSSATAPNPTSPHGLPQALPILHAGGTEASLAQVGASSADIRASKLIPVAANK